jgi:hypothetical protein
VEVIHLGPLSLDFGSSMQEGSNLGLSVNQENVQDDLDLVLAFPTALTNFMPLELQLEDLMNDEEMQHAIISNVSPSLHNGGQAASQTSSLQNIDHPASHNGNILLDLNMIITDNQDESLINQFQPIHLNSETEGQSNFAVVASLAQEQGQDLYNL